MHMNYNGRTYPYPVLGINENFIDDINKDNFKPTLNVSSDYRKIKLEVTYQLRNEELLKQIKTNKVEFCMQLYCRSTMFRHSFLSKKQTEIFELNATALRDQVEVDFFICAIEDIHSYTNTQFSLIYAGSSFEIEAGDILAFGGSTIFFANKSPEELKNISSFMSIISENMSDEPMKIDYDNDKIIIILSEEDYENYGLIKDLSSFTSTLHSSVVLPVLAEVIRYMETIDGQDYKDKKWFIILSKLLEDKKASDPLIKAQKILDLPVNRSFSSLIKI